MPTTTGNIFSAFAAGATQELGLTQVQNENLCKMIRLAPAGCPHSSLVTLAKKMSEPMNQDALRRFKDYINNWMGMQQPETVQQLQQQQQLDQQRQMLLQQQMLRYQHQQRHAKMHQYGQDKAQAGWQQHQLQQQQSVQPSAAEAGAKLASEEPGSQQGQEDDYGKLAVARHAKVSRISLTHC